jgi:hypothetical protein
MCITGMMSVMCVSLMPHVARSTSHRLARASLRFFTSRQEVPYRP